MGGGPGVPGLPDLPGSGHLYDHGHLPGGRVPHVRQVNRQLTLISGAYIWFYDLQNYFAKK